METDFVDVFRAIDNAARARQAFHPRRKKFKARLRAKYAKNK